MRLFLFFVLCCLGSLVSFLGEARADIGRAYLLSPEMRFERDSSQNVVDRKPLNISLGYQKLRWSFLLEYARFSEGSGSATYFVDRTHEDIVVWTRYHFWNATFLEGRQNLQLYGGLGLGGYKESLVTTFQGQSRKDTGSLLFMSGLSAGAESSLKITESFLFSLGLEGRTLVASDFDPNPLWSLVLRVGVGFIF